MNKNQKLVQQQFINNEEAVIKRLKSVYKQSLKDIEEKAKDLQKDIEKLDKLAKLSISEEEKEIILSKQRSKVYQKQYQEALKKQVGDIYDLMLKEEYKTVSDYLNQCYEDGFIGTMFDLQGQGIPLCFPLDQESMVRAVQLDSKISQGLYSRLGEDVSMLKKKITAQISRGISTGMSFEQVAKQLAGYTNIGYNNAIRIARTEGHRIQVQAGMDACYKAKDMGADVVKQWDSTLDSSTRESHAKVDGEIRELDKKFSNGLLFPGDPSGGAAEVVNCRCALLQRARWALDEDELKTLQERAEYFGLDKAKEFEDYKKKYLKAVEQDGTTVPLDITENGKFIQLRIADQDEYAKYIEHEFATQKMAVKELKQMWDKTVGYIQNSQGYQDINGYLRGLKAKLDVPRRKITINVMDRITKNNSLKKNYIGVRKVDSGYLENVLGLDVTNLFKTSLQKNAFGRKQPVSIPKDKAAAETIADLIRQLIGTSKGTIQDEAFTSVSLSENLNYFTHFPIKFEIQMPIGTKGIITNNLAESEFITKKGSSIDIIGAEVYNDGGKYCVKILARLLQ